MYPGALTDELLNSTGTTGKKNGNIIFNIIAYIGLISAKNKCRIIMTSSKMSVKKAQINSSVSAL